ncbi:MAG: hypothetical protein U5K69_08755 [Balneolaceae bacterium]|nr:hypothetical protein [Balneolaceae bacterium]
MSSDLEAIRSKLKEQRAMLMDKPNVVATGIGYKKREGVKTKELGIICSVEIKKDLKKLGPNDVIPSTIDDVSTDVVPSGPFVARQNPTGRFRPAPGGVSIGHKDITAGTLGCLVQKNNTLYILSNNHVLANSNEAEIGDAILQPGPIDGGRNPQDQIATLSEFVPIYFEGDEGNGGGNGGCVTSNFLASILNALASGVGSGVRMKPYRIQQEENRVDAAIAEPLDTDDVENTIMEIGQISGTREAELGMAVKKSGRTTEFTTGTIEQIDVTVRVNYGSNKVATFVDQLIAGAMSQGGDSGSAVLDNDNNLVGLLFAGSDTATIINPIGDVFNALGVTLPD